MSQAELTRFHGRLRPRPAEAFLTLRAFALSLGPDVIEHVDDGNVSYLRRERRFLVVRADRSRLTLSFPRELHLDDPGGQLLRRGEERYLAVESADAIDGHVQKFVRDAYAVAR